MLAAALWGVAGHAAIPVQQTTSLTWMQVYDAVVRHDANAAGKLVSYAERQGPGIVRDYYARRIQAAQDLCKGQPKRKSSCDQEASELRNELAGIEKLARAGKASAGGESLMIRLYVGAVIFRAQVASDILDPKVDRIIRRCRREADRQACESRASGELKAAQDAANASYLLVQLAAMKASQGRKDEAEERRLISLLNGLLPALESSAPQGES